MEETIFRQRQVCYRLRVISPLLHQVIPFARQVRELLVLIREYGPEAVSAALRQAHAAGAFGADYIANILRQQQTRREVQPPLRFQDPLLNELATDPLSLLDYDSFILGSKKDSDDPTTTEAGATESDHHEPPSGSDVG